MDDSGRPLALTSHTLAAVPIAIGGKGLPEGVVFRDDMPDAGRLPIGSSSTTSSRRCSADGPRRKLKAVDWVRCIPPERVWTSADQNVRPLTVGLANVTATYVNLLGYEAPECWVPSLLTVKT